MEYIKTLSQLVKKLSNCKNDEVDDLVKSIKIPKIEFEEHASWDDNFYTRNCIARTNDFELLLLCWQAGQKTPIHDHDDQDCWVYMVSGEITEKRFDVDDDDKPFKINTSVLEVQENYFINDGIALHSLHNETEERCMSLHIYASPINECRYFDADKGVFKKRKLSYTTV